MFQSSFKFPALFLMIQKLIILSKQKMGDLQSIQISLSSNEDWKSIRQQNVSSARLKFVEWSYALTLGIACLMMSVSLILLLPDKHCTGAMRVFHEEGLIYKLGRGWYQHSLKMILIRFVEIDAISP